MVPVSTRPSTATMTSTVLTAQTRQIAVSKLPSLIRLLTYLTTSSRRTCRATRARDVFRPKRLLTDADFAVSKQPSAIILFSSAVLCQWFLSGFMCQNSTDTFGADRGLVAVIRNAVCFSLVSLIANMLVSIYWSDTEGDYLTDIQTAAFLRSISGLYKVYGAHSFSALKLSAVRQEWDLVRKKFCSSNPHEVLCWSGVPNKAGVISGQNVGLKSKPKVVVVVVVVVVWFTPCGLQMSSRHGSTIPSVILHTGHITNWTIQLAIRHNRPTHCATYKDSLRQP